MINKKSIKFLISIMLIITMVIALFTTIVNAADTTITTKLSRTRWVKNSSGTYVEKRAYALNTGSDHPIYQILSVNGSTTKGSNYYCLNATAGATWTNNRVGAAVDYTKSYDLVNDKTAISGLSSSIYSKTATSTYYPQIMWLLDNMYAPGGTSIESLLAKAGIVSTTDGGKKTYYYDADVNPSSVFSNTNSVLYNNLAGNPNVGDWGYRYWDTSDNQVNVVLTDYPELVETVQQAAIWYFTNYKANGHSEYNCYTSSGSASPKSWLRYAEKSSPTSLSLLANETVQGSDGEGGTETVDKGAMLQEQADILYNYLIDKANANSSYTSTSVGTILLEYTGSGSDSKFTESGDNYIVGPFKITTTGSVTGLSVTPGTVTNSTGTTKTLKANEEFYVKVAKSSINDRITVKATASSTATVKTLWIGKTTDSNTTAEQPLVEVEKKTTPLSSEVTLTLEKQFDLALRKRIVKVENSEGTTLSILNEEGKDASRSLTNINTNTIPVTATYKHRKDPVVVKTGDVVTFRISIYNEGEINGYASKIVDQLPAGMRSVLSKDATITSNKGTVYTITSYDTTINKIELTANRATAKTINKLSGTTLSQDYIEIKCNVIQTAETDGQTKHYLTNVAYISEEYDTENNKIITEDRDGNESKTTESPSKTASELNSTDANSYKGNTSNGNVKTTGTNNDYYFEGEQDDDDFEKLVVNPKTFDLKLMKFISAIADRATTRNITIDSSKLKTGAKTTADYDVSKVPLKVTTGDIVTYTLRIYNEGEIDGYASEITEDIPEGLEFVASLNPDWTVSGDGKTITTDFLSKSKSEGNLLRAFDSENDNGHGSGLSYKDVTVKLRVTSTNVNNIIRNEAAITEDTDSNGNPVNDRDSDTEEWKKENSSDKYEDNSDYPKYKEDDEDYDNIKLSQIDLSLRKFISAIGTDLSNESKTTTYNRAPKVDTSKLKAGTAETAIYKHSKEPIYLNVGDYVLYTIRVYNEGEIDGYASQIVDYLPENLDFVSSEETYIKNINDKWNYDSATRKVTTKNTAINATTLLNAFNSSADDGNGSGLSYVDVQIVCKVNDSTPSNKKLTNIAEISEYKNKNEVVVNKDRDSDSNNLDYPTNPETYKDDKIQSGDPYIPGEQDDDDFEKVIVRKPGTYSIVIVKEDKDGEQLNSTATFEINGETKTVTGRLTIAQDVEINGENVNTPDVYTIKETQAPDEYCEFGGTITVTANKKADGTSYELDSVAYEIKDIDGNEITTDDATVTLRNGNIYVTVIDYDEPKIHKGVKTVENQDSGYNKDEEHTWAIKSDIPGDIARYKKYEVVDDIDYRLKYVENSVEVKVGDTTLTENTDYKVVYDNTSNSVKSGTLKIIFIGDSQTVSSKLKNNAGKKIDIKFKTTFATDDNGNIIAGLGTEVPNQAKLEYSNSANISDEKVTEIPEVHTGGITLFKYVKDGTDKKALKGAEFAVYKTEADANAKRNEIMKATSGDDGIVRFIGLEYGEDAKDKEENKTAAGLYDHDSSKQSTKYWISETKSPTKYALSNDVIEVTVNATSYEQDIARIPAKNQVENEKKPFDLKLIKYISAVNNKESNRKITVDSSKLKNGTKTTADYDVTKVPLSVQEGDYVTYTFRIYNEGGLNGYASEITEDIPEGLEYDASVNTDPAWTVSADGRTISTDYLSRAKSTDNLINAFDSENDDGKGSGLSYKEVSVKLKVTKDAKNIVRNEAEISKDEDEDGEDVTDRDSIPEEWKKEDSDENYEDNPDYPKYKEDDEDYDNIKLAKPDFALRKYIAKVSSDGNFRDTKTTKTYDREPQVDTSKLKSGKETTAIYNHSKKQIELFPGDYILYTIRVYNEGEVDGYASQIIDYLPEYLSFVDSTDTQIKSINDNWTYDANTRKVTTTKDAPNSTKLLKAFDSKNDNGKGSGLYYTDVQIICRVSKTVAVGKKLTNIAEISEYKNGNKIIVDKDKDSEPKNLDYPENPESYKDSEIEKGDKYIPGQQDDDDFEKVIIREPKKFDLALRKFITDISGKAVNARIPKLSYKNNKITYTHPKDVVKVVVGNTVTYTLRVFNEGEISGYAEKITDDIPEYLEYLPNNSTNKEYRWKMYDKNGKETSNVKNAVKIVTDYASKANGESLMKSKSLKENPNLLDAFDKTKGITSTNPDFVDVKVAFKVKDPNSNKTVITNKAQISDDADEDGNPVNDKDSIPDRWNEGEDDQDYENVSVEYFDLSLLKYVTKTIVTANGKTTSTKTGNTGAKTDITPKVEIYRKSVNRTIVKFEFTIKVTNEGDIAGYAKEVTDYVPKGLKFYASDNKGWKDEGNNVISTTLLKDTLLKPGQSATVKVILRWINGESNLGLKTNTAEISKDKNDKGVPDRDSIPDNKKNGEDDIDDAPVLLTISTGILENPIAFVTGTLAILVVLGLGIFAIKKFIIE